MGIVLYINSIAHAFVPRGLLTFVRIALFAEKTLFAEAEILIEGNAALATDGNSEDFTPETPIGVYHSHLRLFVAYRSPLLTLYHKFTTSV